MNKGNLLKVLAVSIAVLLAPVACSPAPEEAEPLQGARIGGPFTLTDQDGQQVRDTDFDGRYRLVYFGYTYCPDVCPTDLATLSNGLRKFEAEHGTRAARVQPIFITIDPARDTAPVLKQFVAAFHPRLIGLTGTQEQIAGVAKAFGVPFSKGASTSASDYLMDHGRMVLLQGPHGEPIALVPQDQGADAVAAELAQWVK